MPQYEHIGCVNIRGVNDTSSNVFRSVTLDATAKRTTIMQLLLILAFKCNMAVTQIVNLAFCLMATTKYPLELNMPDLYRDIS
jgi:hypothetical protein